MVLAYPIYLFILRGDAPITGVNPFANTILKSHVEEKLILNNPIYFTILHTNDFHSQMTGLGPDLNFTPKVGDGDPVLGHTARLISAVRTIRENRQNSLHKTFLFDSGDFLYGSLFHVLGPNPKSALLPEYSFLSLAGYDGLSLGNHDFDAGEAGIAISFAKAKKLKLNLPFITTNIRFKENLKDDSSLKTFFKDGGVNSAEVACKEFLIYKILANPRNADDVAIKMGVIGLVGPNAAKLSATTRKSTQFIGFNDKRGKYEFNNFHSFVQKKVNKLKSDYGCQLVVVLLHGGAPEDENLAKKVSGIDVILSGHSHRVYTKKVKSTIIAQAGFGGANLGVLDFEYSSDGLKLINPKNTRMVIDDSVPVDKDMIPIIEEAEREVDWFIKADGFKMNDEICRVNKDLRKGRYPNDDAGIFVANALLRSVNSRIATPVDVYFSSYGLIRSEFRTFSNKTTTYTFSDIFRFSPLGFDENGFPGASVVVFNLSKNEVKLLLEAMTFLSKKTPSYEPAISSNLQYEYSTFDIPMFKLTNLKLNGQPYDKWPNRIRIATSRFFAKNLLKITGYTKGLLRIVPRDAKGIAITKFKSTKLSKEHLLLAEELQRNPTSKLTEPNAQL